FAVQTNDDVAVAQPGALGRGVGRDLVDIGRLEIGREAERLAHRVRHRPDLGAEIAALDRLAAHQAVGDFLGDRGRNGEADADRPAGGGEDGGVHADHPAIDVEGRAAGITAVYGRVD